MGIYIKKYIKNSDGVHFDSEIHAIKIQLKRLWI